MIKVTFLNDQRFLLQDSITTAWLSKLERGKYLSRSKREKNRDTATSRITECRGSVAAKIGNIVAVSR
jgi:hypothetical protein